MALHPYSLYFILFYSSISPIQAHSLTLRQRHPQHQHSHFQAPSHHQDHHPDLLLLQQNYIYEVIVFFKIIVTTLT